MNKFEGHTPGPWKELIDNDGWVYVVGPNHEELYYPDGEFGGHLGFICSIGDMEDTEKEDHANAALIAAAPDLLRQRDELAAALCIYADKENWTDFVTEEMEPEDWPAWTAEINLPDKSAFYLEGDGWEVAKQALAALDQEAG